MTTYETVEGTTPRPYVAHQPRVITRRDTDSDLYMMSEIGDGVFVAWGTCRRCSVQVYDCKCKEGPQEPPFMQTWRDERFTKELRKRPEPGYDLLPDVIEWVKDRGYAVVSPDDCKKALAAAQDAQDAAYGDSNDSEIYLLREALEYSLGCFGLDLPEGRDPDDEDEEAEDFLSDLPAEADADEGIDVTDQVLTLDAAIEAAQAARMSDTKTEKGEWDAEF